MINRQGLEGDYSARPVPLFPLSTVLSFGPRAVIPVSIRRKANIQLCSSKDLVTLEKKNKKGYRCSHVNGLLSPVGVLKTLFPLCFAPLRVSQHIVILTTELPHRFFTRFLSWAIVSESFFFFLTNESSVISDVMHTPAFPTLSIVHNKSCSGSVFHKFDLLFQHFVPLALLCKKCIVHDFYIVVHQSFKPESQSGVAINVHPTSSS